MKLLSLITITGALVLSATAAPTKTTKTKVAILGGGAAGISAAKELVANGVHDFVIIEARDELGGRAHNLEFAGYQIEKGCNWVQGLGTNPIYELAKKWDLDIVENNYDDLAFYDNHGKINGTKAYNDFNDALDASYDLAENRSKTHQADISSRAALDLVGWNPLKPIEQAVEYYAFDWEFAEDPDVTSAFYAYVGEDSYDGSFGPNSDDDKFVIDQRGFKYIFVQEAKQYLKENDPRLMLSTTVTNVKWSDKGVTISTKDGAKIEADYAITTFSLGVLQNDDVTWTPEMPDWKRVGVFGFHMATYLKLFLAWDHQFWDDNQYTVYADPASRGFYNTWQNFNAFFPKNKTSNIFYVTLTQDQAYRIEAMSDEDIKAEVTEVVRGMYGKHINPPVDMFVPRWHSDPLFRGTYSNWPIGELEEHHKNMRAPMGRVWFAGEAMSRGFYGYLQGAWITGSETGTNVAKCINSKCPKQPYYPKVVLNNEKPHFVKREEWM
ncbi:hypothetical protein INT43_004638 [Umbelopsis isabellina]|uniref:Amine oxidase n=1 Tax=Mortierella isabellina TaxID=91625 RepID=A0A8H7PG01_MORIS|nr:hypothetical protein INT43_004638 [Umbelopsis isabellina]